MVNQAIPVVISLFLLATITGVMTIRPHNDWDQPLDFTCADNKILSYIYSVHSDRTEDRRWTLGCRGAPGGGKLWKCRKTPYVNHYDEVLAFQCNGEGFITGMYGVHRNDEEDRMFQFMCCDLETGEVVLGCTYTGWENNFDYTLNYTVPNGKVLRGVISDHSNSKEDRRFQFHICSVGNRCR